MVHVVFKLLSKSNYNAYSFDIHFYGYMSMVSAGTNEFDGA